MSDKRYYWLKLPRGFFKRHDIEILEDRQNGKEIVLIYVRLMLESIDHNGRLRYSEEIPYDSEMLKTLTRTKDVETFESAMSTLKRFGLIKILDDQTIYIKEAEKLLGCEAWSTERSRNSRAKSQEDAELLQCNNVALQSQQDATKCNEEKELEKELDKDTEIDKDIGANKSPKTRFQKPSVSEIESYCQERKNGISGQRFFDFYESKGWMIGNNRMKDWKAAIRTWEQKQKPQEQPKADYSSTTW